MDIDFLSLGLRWLHIVGAVTLLGGLFYQRFVVLPAAEKLDDAARANMIAALRGSWSKLVMISAMVLLVSGFVNFFLTIGAFKAPAPELPGYYHMMFGIKFLIAMIIFFLASILSGKSDAAERFRAKAKTWLNLCVLLAVLLIAISGVMRGSHVGPNLDATSPETPAAESNE